MEALKLPANPKRMRHSGALAPARPPVRWLKLKIACAALAAVATLFMIAFLWKPSIAYRDGAPPDFIAAVGTTEIPRAMIQLYANGSATLTLSDTQITDIAAGALDRNSRTVPGPVATAVRRNVPPIVDTVCGCRIDGASVTLCARCGKWLSFYTTVSGILSQSDNGDIAFQATSARIGLFPVPARFLAMAGASGKQVLYGANEGNVCVTSMAPKKGAITLELSTVSTE
jgi:hypothetical protein